MVALSGGDRLTGWVLVAASFLLGSVPFGVLVARAKGVDLRSSGSGNIGATNVGRTLGKGPGAVVLVLDVLKGAVPAWVCAFLGVVVGSLGVSESALVCGVAAVLGHMYSPFLGFNGGKGIATGLGMLIGAAPVVASAVVVVFVLGMVGTRVVSLSSLLAAWGMVVAGLVLGYAVVWLGLFGLVAVLVTARHWPNIQRIVKGEEKKFSFAGKGSGGGDGS